MLKTTTSKKQTNQTKPHIRKNDEVVVLAGRDRGKRGKVLRVDAKRNKAIVERVNFLKRHTRPNPSKNVAGGIVEREAPIHTGNLMLVCPSCGEPTRVGTRREGGEVTRVCKKCDTDIR